MNTYVPSDHGQQSNTTERNAQPIQNSNQINTIVICNPF